MRPWTCFLSFAVGWWAAAKGAGFRRSEPATLLGAIAWLLGVPLGLIIILFLLGVGH